MKKSALSLLLAWTLMLGMIPINATAAEPYTDVPVVSELVPEPLPEKPEAIKSEEPESTEPEVPEASEPEAPESTEPQVPEVVEPEVPETTEPEVPEIIEPEIPVITPPVIELPMLELEPAIEVPEVLADGSEITSQEQL